MIRQRKAFALIVALTTLLYWSDLVGAAPTVPGAVYSDLFAQGANKPVERIQQELQQAGIKDVKPTDWFAGSVTVIIQAGLMKGFSDGDFHPEATLAQGDAISVFAKVLGIASKNDTSDQSIDKMKQAGLVSGDTLPNADMTRLSLAKLLAKALGVKAKPITSPTGYPFTADYDKVSSEDRGILKALYDLGIFKGYPDHSFGPNDILTRAQLAILVDRILGAQ